ncbi:MAG: AEC family transporter [Alphaproteobacteria bacterium]|nr:AEC family transporter [Alphaproteobacteria bacterium]
MTAGLFAIVVPVFLTAAIGFAWERSGRVFDTDFVTGIVLTIATPCLVFSSLTRLDVSLETLGAIAGSYLAVLVVLGVAGAVIIRSALRLSLPSYLPTVMFGNLGNMGIPLAFFAFGDEGLALAVAAFSVHSVAQFTVGISIHAGGVHAKQLIRTPVLWGVLFSLPFMFTRTALPDWATNTVELLASLVVPLMLLTLGVSLARMRLKRLRRSVGFAIARLLGGLAASIVVAELFGLDGIVRSVLILQSTMPVAIFNYVFALRYDREPQDVAAAIIISTVISFATMPLLLILVL